MKKKLIIVKQKCYGKVYENIEVEFILLKNFLGNSEIKLDKNRNNHEIEDLIYPEIICHLVNKILNKKNLLKLVQMQLEKKFLNLHFHLMESLI